MEKNIFFKKECIYVYNWLSLLYNSLAQHCTSDMKSESCSAMSDSLPPQGLYSPWNSPGQNTGVGSLSLLQGMFPTQRSNPGLLHCRWILYHLSHQGSPRIACPFSGGSSWPRCQTRVSCITGGFFMSWATREAPFVHTHAMKVQFWSCSLFQNLP